MLYYITQGDETESPSLRGFDGLRGGAKMEKETMIEQTAELLRQLYYEDVEFFWDMIARYAAKKGIA